MVGSLTASKNYLYAIYFSNCPLYGVKLFFKKNVMNATEGDQRSKVTMIAEKFYSESKQHSFFSPNVLALSFTLLNFMLGNFQLLDKLC